MIESVLPGFGATAAIMSTSYSDNDLREANERIQQFDKNKNGYIDADEITPIFSGSPFDYDINRDRRLSAVELAIRQARRREAGEDRKEARNAEPAAEQRTGEAPNLFNGRNSYRPVAARPTLAGVPGFVGDKDANGDGQVSMAEYSSDWTDELMAQFAEYDFNNDGVITAEEALRSVEIGTVSQIMTSRSGGAANAEVVVAEDSAALDSIDKKYVDYATRILKRNDGNGDGVLVPSEMAKMLLSPIAADVNRDGKVTLAEYAAYLQTKDGR